MTKATLLLLILFLPLAGCRDDTPPAWLSANFSCAPPPAEPDGILVEKGMVSDRIVFLGYRFDTSGGPFGISARVTLARMDSGMAGISDTELVFFGKVPGDCVPDRIVLSVDVPGHGRTDLVRMVNDEGVENLLSRTENGVTYLVYRDSGKENRGTATSILRRLASFAGGVVEMRDGDRTLLSRTLSTSDRAAMYDARLLSLATVAGRCPAEPYAGETGVIPGTITPERLSEIMDGR